MTLANLNLAWVTVVLDNLDVCIRVEGKLVQYPSIMLAGEDRNGEPVDLPTPLWDWELVSSGDNVIMCFDDTAVSEVEIEREGTVSETRTIYLKNSFTEVEL